MIPLSIHKMNMDGKGLSAQLMSDLSTKSESMCLAIIQVGSDPASNVYIKHKLRACDKINALCRHIQLDEKVTTQHLGDVIEDLNGDDSVTGYIIQLPVPQHIDLSHIVTKINPDKDVDCMNPVNIGRYVAGSPHADLFIPATPAGILKLLEHYEVPTRGKCCVIIGKSDIVGKPLSILLSNEQTYAATTICCDVHTQKLEQYLPLADILIVATGVPHLVNDPTKLKPNVVIIDVGITRTESGKLIGDVDTEAVRKVASLVTPVPGGVGPMTVHGLMNNLCIAAKAHEQKRALARNMSAGDPESVCGNTN
jgi:methylenetetrahydrofolate dehydrogenase (NADP+)/methenyltetrahydrofolate cyclohydrolase